MWEHFYPPFGQEFSGNIGFVHRHIVPMQHPIARGHRVHAHLLEGLDKEGQDIHNIAGIDLSTDGVIMCVYDPLSVKEDEEHFLLPRFLKLWLGLGQTPF